MFEQKIKKIILCGVEKCPFGLEKINESCAICRYKEEIILKNNIPFLFIEVTNKIEYSCYTKKNSKEIYDKCPFGHSNADKRCKGCARFSAKAIKSETKEL